MKKYTILKLVMKSVLGKLNFPLALSIDVTYKCNLNCKHCYFKKQKYTHELSEDEWANKIREIKRLYNIIHCTWVGGEPLLRKNIIEANKKFFIFNWIVTNGTLEIPDWKDCIFFVSIDGTKKFHERIRGKMTFDKIKNNIINSKSKIFLDMVINSMNYTCIENMLKEWSGTNVKGINFDFYTPLRKDDELFIPFNKRDKILDKILELKKEYGESILLSKKAIELMKSQNYKKIIGENCIVKKSALCLDPEGKIKKPCVMGMVDCENCGCIVPYALTVFLNKDLESLRILSKLTP